MKKKSERHKSVREAIEDSVPTYHKSLMTDKNLVGWLDDIVVGPTKKFKYDGLQITFVPNPKFDEKK